MVRKTVFLLTLLSSLLLTYCSRETVDFTDPDFQPERLKELMPLQQGKYITYRIDSIIPIRQGRALEIRRYQLKDVVDTLITDNLGRSSYRVFRYLNDSLATGSWRPIGTYFVTRLDQRVEVIENNLRTVKLQLPLRVDHTWKGNRHLPDGAFGAYNDARFSEVSEWNYTYTNVGPERIHNRNFDSVWTVLHFNEVADTISIPAGLRSAHHRLYGIGYSQEKYVPRIGLVARQFLMIENQPNQIDATNYDPYKTGFGTRMWMIDHN